MTVTTTPAPQPAAQPLDPREADYSRRGMFAYHNCSRCDHGRLPCRQGQHNTCGNPVARND
jgi:hypothetical protein